MYNLFVPGLKFYPMNMYEDFTATYLVAYYDV